MKSALLCALAFLLLISPSLGTGGDVNCGSYKTFRSSVERGLNVRVDKCGGFRVSYDGDIWLEGPRGLNVWHHGQWHTDLKPEGNPENIDGVDVFGAFVGWAFRWVLGGASVETSIRLYPELSAAIFRQAYPDGLEATSIQNKDSVANPFPKFEWVDDDLRYLTYNYSFARPLIGDVNDIYPVTGVIGGAPLVLFERKPQPWSLVISPIDHFMTSIHSRSGPYYVCGTNGLVQSYPRGFTHETVMVGGQGVGRTLNRWGSMLLARSGKKSYREDAITEHISYWTGSGSFYKYLAEPGRTYQQSLSDVYRYGRSIGVPFQGIQLDSVWYPKDRDLDANGNIIHGNFSTGSQQGQTYLWEPYAPEVFQNMEQFSEDIERGRLILHNRMISIKSPYCNASAGLFSFRCLVSQARQEALPLDDAFWDYIWNKPLTWGFHTYLQDWLKETYAMPEAMINVDILEEWMDTMNRAGQRYGISIMFSEPLPAHLLKSTEMDMVNTARGSGDYQPARTNYYMAYTGFLNRILGLIPFKQTFWSSGDLEPNCKSDYERCQEPNPEINALVAALSGGTFTPSDKIGYLNATRLQRGIRPDGRILKPGGPSLIPFDWAFVDSPVSPSDRPGGVFQENFTQVWYTETRYPLLDSEAGDELHWYFLLALNTTKSYVVRPSDFVQIENAYSRNEQRRLESRTFQVYDYYDPAHKLRLFDEDHLFPLPRLNNGSNTSRFDKLPFSYHVLCPVLSNGWVLLGETGKFVPISPDRIQNITPLTNALQLQIVGIPDEHVSLELRLPNRSSNSHISCTIPRSGRATLECEVGSSSTSSPLSCACN